MFIKQYVMAQNALTARVEALAEKLKDEHGEVAGEVMVTAMMVAAAAAIYAKKGELKTMADSVATSIN